MFRNNAEPRNRHQIPRFRRKLFRFRNLRGACGRAVRGLGDGWKFRLCLGSARPGKHLNHQKQRF
jgi:hypothetical protein